MAPDDFAAGDESMSEKCVRHALQPWMAPDDFAAGD
jgi:hypothetical protein